MISVDIKTDVKQEIKKLVALSFSLEFKVYLKKFIPSGDVTISHNTRLHVLVQRPDLLKE